MRIGEFEKAKTANDGTRVVTVFNHKTSGTYGSCPIAFCEKDLYEATEAYRKAFREQKNESEFIFATGNDTEPDCREAIKWGKKEMLGNILTEKERNSLTAKVWTMMGFLTMTCDYLLFCFLTVVCNLRYRESSGPCVWKKVLIQS